MNNYLYSNSRKSFYPVSLIENYRNSVEGLPEDLVEVSDSDFNEFSQSRTNECCNLTESGFEWIPKGPEPVSVEDAYRIKSILLNSANNTISIWQTKLMLNRLSDEDKIKLNAWLDYIDEVEAIDPNSVEDPSAIQWPTAPEA